MAKTITESRYSPVARWKLLGNEAIVTVDRLPTFKAEIRSYVNRVNPYKNQRRYVMFAKYGNAFVAYENTHNRSFAFRRAREVIAAMNRASWVPYLTSGNL